MIRYQNPLLLHNRPSMPLEIPKLNLKVTRLLRNPKLKATRLEHNRTRLVPNRPAMPLEVPKLKKRRLVQNRPAMPLVVHNGVRLVQPSTCKECWSMCMTMTWMSEKASNKCSPSSYGLQIAAKRLQLGCKWQQTCCN